jgi:hypothetical protein
VGLVFPQVIADVPHICDGKRRPADAHLAAQHLFETGVHLAFLDELATFRRVFSFEHSRPETRIFVLESRGNQLRFLFPRELKFHVDLLIPAWV